MAKTPRTGPSGPSSATGPPIPTLPSTYSVHEFHNYGFTSTGISPGLHFHLSGTINARSDIPLVPALNPASPTQQKHNFVLHWMNNKEMQFTMEAEKIMEDLFRVAMDRDDNLDLEFSEEATEASVERAMNSGGPPGRPPPPRKGFPKKLEGVPHASSTSSLAQSEVSQTGSGGGGRGGSIGSAQLNVNLSDMLDNRIDRILKEWHQNSDLLFSVHPVDGSLLVWVADFLDEYLPGSFRQAQVSFSCRIPNAIPVGDAMTMEANVELFNGMNILNLKEFFKEKEKEENGVADKEKRGENGEGSEDENEEEEREVKEETKSPKKERKSKSQKYKPPPIVSLISKHSNGTLNLWSVMFAEKSKFSQLLNISHTARASGHRFRVNGITCHPVLPLLLTTSHHNIVHNEGTLTDEVGKKIFFCVSCLERFFVDALQLLFKKSLFVLFLFFFLLFFSYYY